MGQQPNKPVVMYPDSGVYIDAVRQFNAKFKIILSGSQTSNLSTVVDDLIYSTSASRHQIHTREDETILVLNGTLQIYLNGEQFCARAGTTFYIPRNTSQSQRTIGSKPVHVQITFTPSGLENYLYQIMPLLNDPIINQTAATEIATNNGLIFKDEVEWKDIGCVFEDSTNAASSFTLNKNIALKEFSILFVFLSFFHFF